MCCWFYAVTITVSFCKDDLNKNWLPATATELVIQVTAWQSLVDFLKIRAFRPKRPSLLPFVLSNGFGYIRRHPSSPKAKRLPLVCSRISISVSLSSKSQRSPFTVLSRYCELGNRSCLAKWRTLSGDSVRRIEEGSEDGILWPKLVANRAAQRLALELKERATCPCLAHRLLGQKCPSLSKV